METFIPPQSKSEKLLNYKKYLYGLIPCLILGSVFAFLWSGRHQRAETDYISASNAFTKWSQVLDKKIRKILINSKD